MFIERPAIPAQYTVADWSSPTRLLLAGTTPNEQDGAVLLQVIGSRMFQVLLYAHVLLQ